MWRLPVRKADRGPISYDRTKDQSNGPVRFVQVHLKIKKAWIFILGLLVAPPRIELGTHGFSVIPKTL